MKRIPIMAFALVLAASVLSGCVTAGGGKLTNEFELKGAANSVLVYGAFLDSRGFLGSNQYDAMTFYQINPALKTQIVMAKTNSLQKYWFAEDVMPGGNFKLVYFAEGSGNSVYYTTPGLSGKNITDFDTPETPGIYFAGYCDIKKDGGHLSKDSSEELKILKAMKIHLIGSGWEKLVKARIEELENAKK